MFIGIASLEGSLVLTVTILNTNFFLAWFLVFRAEFVYFNFQNLWKIQDLRDDCRIVIHNTICSLVIRNISVTWYHFSTSNKHVSLQLLKSSLYLQKVHFGFHVKLYDIFIFITITSSGEKRKSRPKVLPSEKWIHSSTFASQTEARFVKCHTWRQAVAGSNTTRIERQKCLRHRGTSFSRNRTKCVKWNVK
jgi:hypothetical protein